MDFQRERDFSDRQRDLAFLALALAIDGDEGRADHLRAIARARYEAALVQIKEQATA